MVAKSEARPTVSALKLGTRRTFWILLFAELAYTYSPWSVIPWIGSLLSRACDIPILTITRWFALHLFHIHGVAATDHATNSRDTALSWIALLVITLLSMVLASAWTFFDRDICREDKRSIWYRYVLRLMLVFIMFRYGIFKVFPLQMSRTSLGVLNEAVGQTSPMTLLWTLIGLKPFYQVGSGVLETLCGLLMVFECTSVPGALMGLVIMTNVVWLNFAFDVPVKLGAIQILVALGALIWPHVKSMAKFLFQAGSSTLQSVSLPRFKSKRSLRLALAMQFAFVSLSLFFFVPVSYRLARAEAKAVQNPSALSGEWTVESSQVIEQGVSRTSPLRTAEGSPVSALFFEPDGRVMARSEDGRLWRAFVQIDPKKETLTLDSGYFEGAGFGETYSYITSAGTNMMLLRSSSNERASVRQVVLQRVQLPSTYPLLKERMHWIQEWAIER